LGAHSPDLTLTDDVAGPVELVGKEAVAELGVVVMGGDESIDEAGVLSSRWLTGLASLE
jgi:hypothetical protein